MQIRLATKEDAGAISDMIRTLAAKFIAYEYSAEGASNLLSSLTPEAITGLMDASFRYHVAEGNGVIAGVVATRDDRHLYHLFVAEPFQRRGLARKLWGVAKQACLEAGGTGMFTVNSSRYAVEVYKRLGFTEISPPVEEKGVVFVPMKSTRCLDTFSTERLTAERLRPEHLPEYKQLFQDAQVMETLSPDGECLSDEEVERWLGFSMDHWNHYGFGFWAFRDKADQRIVGRAGLKRNEIDGQQEVELAYALLPDYWGQGLATEISRAILRMAFEQIGLEQAVCYTLTTNLASKRVIEKLGFRFEKAMIHAGLPHVFYRLTAADFRG